MKILVMGGTAFFGKAIVEALVEQGHKVTVFSRGNRRPSFLDAGQAEHISGDRHDYDGFREKVYGKRFDAVVDNIAFTGDDVRSAVEAFQGNVGRYVFTSTAAVYYTGSRTMPLQEDDVNFDFQPPAGEEGSPLWNYALGKLQGERALIEQDGPGQLPFTIIRPPVVLGPEDPSLRGHFYFQRLLDRKPIIVTNGGVQSFRLVYSADLVRGYLLALESERARNRTFNLAQAEVITLKDLLREAAQALDVKPELVSIPHEVLAESDLEYREPYARLLNFIPDIAKAERELGYSTTEFSTWVAATARWFRDSYRGNDAPAYENREREVKFAQLYQDAISELGTT